MTDGQIEQLVKAQWLALGLSQRDLAEVLGVPAKSGNGNGHIDAGRLMQVADALGVSHNLFRGLATASPTSEGDTATVEALQELRLLRAFRELQDQNSRRTLIQLAEQIIRRQGQQPDDAG